MPPSKGPAVYTAGDTLPCPACHKHINRVELDKHYTRMHERRHKCPDCTLTYDDPEKLRTHRNNVHSTIVECAHCRKRFINHSTLRQHERNESCRALTSYVCAHCGQTFNKHTKCEEHTSLEHTNVCYVCNLPLPKDRDRAEAHMRRLHSAMFWCDICGDRRDKAFVNRGAIRLHMREKHGPPITYACQLCPSVQLQAEALAQHVREQHDSTEYEWHSCRWCPQSFAHRDALAFHGRAAHIDETITAENEIRKKTARRKVWTMDELFAMLPVQKKQRTQRGATPPPDEIITCPICDTRWPSLAAVKQHLTAHGPRSHQCEQCTASFRTKHMLRQHQLTHSGYKPFACPECNKCFSMKQQVKRHMLKHTGFKAFACEICDRKLGSWPALRNHMRTHDINRPMFVCRFCSRRYKCEHVWRQHEETHGPDAEVKPWQPKRIRKRKERRPKILVDLAVVKETSTSAVMRKIRIEELAAEAERNEAVAESADIIEHLSESEMFDYSPGSEDDEVATQLSDDERIISEAHVETIQPLEVKLCDSLSTNATPAQSDHSKNTITSTIETKPFDSLLANETTVKAEQLRDISQELVKTTSPLKHKKRSPVRRQPNFVHRTPKHEPTSEPETEETHTIPVPFNVKLKKEIPVTDVNPSIQLEILINDSHPANVDPMSRDAFNCSICTRVLTSRQLLDKHMRIHVRAHKCPDCTLSYDNPEKLRTHRNNAHRTTIECSSCNKRFANHSTLRAHERREACRAQVPYICAHCGEMFNKHTKCEEHTSLQHTGQCYVCNLPLPADRRLAELHMFRLHSAQFWCDICGDRRDRGFGHRGAIRLHMREEHGPPITYACQLCPDVQLEADALAQHVRQQHDDDANSSMPTYEWHLCRWCPETFAHRDALATHSRLHIEEIRANDWQKTTKRRKVWTIAELYAMLPKRPRKARGATPPPDEPLNCPICDRVYPSLPATKQHMQLTHGPRNHQCDRCSTSFPTPQGLRIHLLTHSGEKQFACPKCNKCFAIKRTLNVHLKTHTKEKQFSCELCERKLTTWQALKIHMRTHDIHRPMFQCRVCSRKYKLEHVLKQHELSHGPNEEVKPWQPKRVRKSKAKPKQMVDLQRLQETGTSETMRKLHFAAKASGQPENTDDEDMENISEYLSESEIVVYSPDDQDDVQLAKDLETCTEPDQNHKNHQRPSIDALYDLLPAVVDLSASVACPI